MAQYDGLRSQMSSMLEQAKNLAAMEEQLACLDGQAARLKDGT